MADETKACPWCGETILAVAKKCKHCGEFLTAAPAEPATTDAVSVGARRCGFCDYSSASSRDLYLHKVNAHGETETRAPHVGLTTTERAALMASGASHAADPWGEFVWECNGRQWKCLRHGSVRCADCDRRAARPSRAGNSGDRFPTANDVALECPHCHTRGRVIAHNLRMKRGVSGGKATGALLTGGLSVFATGLSRKEAATEAHCEACGTTWHF